MFILIKLLSVLLSRDTRIPCMGTASSDRSDRTRISPFLEIVANYGTSLIENFPYDIVSNVRRKRTEMTIKLGRGLDKHWTGLEYSVTPALKDFRRSPRLHVAWWGTSNWRGMAIVWKPSAARSLARQLPGPRRQLHVGRGGIWTLQASIRPVPFALRPPSPVAHHSRNLLIF